MTAKRAAKRPSKARREVGERTAAKSRRRAEPAAESEEARVPAADDGSPVIVGIGASAGGFDALRRLLPNLVDERLACVIVQHLAADQTDRFLHTLAEHSKRPVLLVEPGLRPEAGSIYLAPAHTLVELAQGRFLLA